MRKYGTTSAGKQRWFCSDCRITSTRKNTEAKHRRYYKAFMRWMHPARPLADVAEELRVSPDTLRRRFDAFLRDIPEAPTPTLAADCLLLDGFWFRGKNRNTGVLLVAAAGGKVVSFAFVPQENQQTWGAFIGNLPAPRMVVTDGQTGLRLAIRALWANVKHQRCQFHISKEVRKKLWPRRKTKEGKELNALREEMSLVKTPAQARKWKAKFKQWETQHCGMLNEREGGIDRLGRRCVGKYKHRALRAAFAHLRDALPFMFFYLTEANGHRTTSALEGGINSRLRDLLRRHRGMRLARQKALIAHFLLSKCG